MANQNPFQTSGFHTITPNQGLISSPHSYANSPTPMSGMPMSATMPSVMTANMSPSMQTSSLQSSMQQGSGMSPAMSVGSTMPPIIASAMNSGMSQGMSPGMVNSVTSNMNSGMVGMGNTNMNTIAANIQSMAARMSPSISTNMGGGLQFNLGPSPQNTNPGQNMVSGNTPSSTPNSSTNDSVVSSVGGAVSSNRMVTATADGAQTQPSRDINTANLCRIGQETVQDIVSRTQEIFQTLKTIQAPNGTANGVNASNEKKVKIQEQLRTIRILFKRLRLIYEKCNDNTLDGMEYTHIESLIPLKDEYDIKTEERKSSEAFRLATEECRELSEAVCQKNRHLKDIVDHLRRIIWEINTMLMMRRS